MVSGGVFLVAIVLSPGSQRRMFAKRLGLLFAIMLVVGLVLSAIQYSVGCPNALGDCYAQALPPYWELIKLLFAFLSYLLWALALIAIFRNLISRFSSKLRES